MLQYDFTEIIARYKELAQHIQEVWKDPQRRKKAIEALDAVAKEFSNNYYWFYVWYTNKFAWKPGNFHMYIAQQIQEFLERETSLAYEILIIQAPPQHGKSMTVTESAPAWCAGKWPDDKQILISYNDDTALRFTKSNKEKISEFGKQLFGIDIETGVGKIDRMDEFSLANHRFHLISRGLGGGITSHGAKYMFIDDPIKSSEQADSENERERQWTEWNMTLKTRLAAGAKVVIIVTRWHEGDLAGLIQANEPPEAVTVINVPCEAEENDLLGRQIGAALCPEIGKGDEWLAQFKKGFMTDSGVRAWNALFQGRPTSAEGNMLKRHWWRYWKPKGTTYGPVHVKKEDGTYEEILPVVLPDWMDETIQSWDCSFKDTKNADKVSGQVWSRNAARLFLRDRVNDRMDIVRTMNEMREMTARWPKALEKLIEDKANGSAVIQLLREKIWGMIAVNPEGGKKARVNAVSPAIEAGNVYLPHPQYAPWVNAFIDECAAFPNGSHDDDVDAMSQALNRLIHRHRSKDPSRRPVYENTLEAHEARHLARVEREHKYGKKAVYM
jgi:predicted phage terminase large subunit-like protein